MHDRDAEPADREELARTGIIDLCHDSDSDREPHSPAADHDDDEGPELAGLEADELEHQAFVDGPVEPDPLVVPVVPALPGDEKKAFRLKNKIVFLTYSQCGTVSTPGLLKDDLITEMCNKRFYSNVAIAKEKHKPTTAEEAKDPAYHFHVLIMHSVPIETRNARFFDMSKDGKVYHPNIQIRGAKANKKTWVQSKTAYLLKEDPNVFTNFQILGTDFRGYRNRKADLEAYVLDLKRQYLADVSEIKCPPGLYVPYGCDEDKAVEKPEGATYDMPDGPRRHSLIIIHGPPGCGKTKWASKFFDGYSHFTRPTAAKDGQRFFYEAYRGESVILWDDIWPHVGLVQEIISVLNYPENEMVEMYGDSRYRKVYKKMKQQNTIVWLMNDDHMTSEAWYAPVLNDIRISGKDGRIAMKIQMRMPGAENDGLSDDERENPDMGFVL